MSKYIWSVLLFSSLSLADPFFGEKLEGENVSLPMERGVTIDSESMSVCRLPPQRNIRYLPSKFAQSKFIGVLKKASQYKAIFMDPQKQLFDLQVNDWLADELIQIIDIDLKSVSYINWQFEKNCQSPAPIILNL